VGKEHSLRQTINKQAREGKSGGPHPATLGWGKLVTVAVMRKAPPERGEGHSPMRTVNKQADPRRQVWCHLLQCAWRGEGVEQWLECGTLHGRMGKGTTPREL
jgi:hypothetical protein